MTNRFAKHPWLSNVLLSVLSVVFCLAVLEVLLRLTLSYHIDYYTSPRGVTSTVLHHPYGETLINSFGEADAEFDINSSKPRVGYFGDSVDRGVGAGYPYRFSELVERALPKYEHWNVGAESGSGIPLYMPEKVRRYGLSYAVYLLNLNYFSPIASSSNNAPYSIAPLKLFVKNSFDFLRDKSYLYNFVRFKIKNALTVWFGFNASGYVAIELWPSKYEHLFKSAMEQINQLGRDTRQAGAELCIVVLPYEMQISHSAATRYKELGFGMEEDFLVGKPQALIRKWLDPQIHLHDPLPYFTPFDSPVGTFYVYDRGDKVDWNHPNREGHRMISESFLKSSDCPFLGADYLSDARHKRSSADAGAASPE